MMSGVSVPYQEPDLADVSPADISGRRLLVVEEALRDHSGHWFEYVSAVVSMNRSAGVEVDVAAHGLIDPALASRINAQGVFSKTNWDGIYNSRYAARRYL